METAQALAAPSLKALGQQSYAARLIIKASNLQPQLDSCGGYRAATFFMPKVACATSPSRPLTKKIGEKLLLSPTPGMLVYPAV